MHHEIRFALVLRLGFVALCLTVCPSFAAESVPDQVDDLKTQALALGVQAAELHDEVLQGRGPTANVYLAASSDHY